MSETPIVITGVGPVTPVGTGRDELAAALDEGLEPVELGQIRLEDHLAAGKTYLDPNSELALVSAALALEDARLEITDANAPSVGLSFGTHLGNVTTVESYCRMLREQGVKLASPLLFIHAYPNTSVSLTAMEFGLGGTSFNFNSGRWCGLQALACAVDELQSGEMSVMLAGSADTYTQTTRPLAVDEPFSAAATVVLERADAAAGRGARALATVAGCGVAASPGDALARALAQASLDETDVDWLLSDALEDAAARTDDRTHSTRLARLVGDSGAATAMTGVVLAALVLGEGKLPAGLGLAALPRTAVIVSADDAGAAAVVLRTLVN